MIEEIILENSMTKSRIKINKTTTIEYVLGDVDFGQVNSKSSTYKYVNQVGYDKESTMLETRDVKISGWIISTDLDETLRNQNMTNRKALLNSFVNPQQNINIYYNDYRLSFTPSSSVKYGVGYENNNNTIVNFEINGVAYDPCFYDKEEKETSGGSVDGMFHFPLIISNQIVPETVIFGVKKPDAYFYINSKSNIDMGFVLILKANGPVVNPKIINVKTNEFIQINKTLLDETVTINSEIGKRSIISEKEGIQTNYFKYKSFDSVWLKTVLGENIFTFSAESLVENLEVYVKFTNKYLEVQQWD